jgi:uncharacterized membrane protein YcaP (DUF421 family)
MPELVVQSLLALAYYAGLVTLFRLAGKRLAGQTTTFDLVVLISLAVVLQNVTLREGPASSLVFLLTVFAAHRLLAIACARSAALRYLVRGRARSLVVDGRVAHDALHEEGMTYDDLLAGLRKLGFDHPSKVRVAALEETGHVSAVGFEQSGS